MGALAMRVEILNSLRYGNNIAAEVPAQIEGNRAWIGVYPPIPNKNLVFRKHPEKFRIRYFEVPLSLLDDENNVYDGVMENLREMYAKDEAELLNILGELAGNTEIFNYPYKCDYPV